VLRPPPGALPCPTSFSGLLEAVAEHAGLVAKARDAAELGSDEWWLQQGSYVPPIPQAHVLQDAIR